MERRREGDRGYIDERRESDEREEREIIDNLRDRR